MAIGGVELLERIDEGGPSERWRARAGRRELVVERGARSVLEPADFERTARVASRLEHASLPRILGYGVDDGRPWIVFEPAPGVSARDRFGARRLSPEAALVLVHPVVDALRALHSAGIAHGGARLANLRLTASGEVRLIGMDLAGKGVDATGDVADVGALLYQLIAGVPPRGLLSSLERRVAPELDGLVSLCLARDRWKRPRDGRALMERLGPLMPCAIERLQVERAALLRDPDGWERTFGATAAARAIEDAERARASGDELGALRAVERALAYRSESPEAAEEPAPDPVATAPVVIQPVPEPSLPAWTHGLVAALGTGLLLALGLGAVVWMSVEEDEAPMAAARERPRRLELAPDLAPESSQAHRERCLVLARLGGVGALAACDEAIERLPGEPALYAARASVRSSAGEHAEALADASRAVELDPQDPGFLYGRYLVRLRAGDDRGAFRDLSAACARHHERSCRELARSRQPGP